MPFVNNIIAKNRKLTFPTWDVVQMELIALKEKPHATLSLYGIGNAQMIFEFVDAKGYFISAFAKDEKEEWVAVDSSKAAELVVVDISGNVDKVPRHVLVSDEIALQSAKCFFESGHRSGDQIWIRSIDLL